jgi:hypothetical protein
LPALPVPDVGGESMTPASGNDAPSLSSMSPERAPQPTTISALPTLIAARSVAAPE